MILCVFDPFHRVWNDIKGAAKRTVCNLWRTILHLCLLLNLSYGPFGSSQFHYKKRALLENFLAAQTHAGNTWARLQSLICQERRIKESTRVEDAMSLFDSVAGLDNFICKGELVKLMRWFSLFQAATQWQGDFFATKMVLEPKLVDAGADADIVDQGPLEQPQRHGGDKQNEREQLAALKRRAGTWSLAPRLITEALVAKKGMLLSVDRAAWKLEIALSGVQSIHRSSSEASLGSRAGANSGKQSLEARHFATPLPPMAAAPRSPPLARRLLHSPA